MKPRRIFRRLPPPWHVISKNIYLRKKNRNNSSFITQNPKITSDFNEVIQSFNSITKHIANRDKSIDSLINVGECPIKSDLHIAVERLSTSLQHLGHCPSYKHKGHFSSLIGQLPSIVSHIAPKELLKLMISIDQSRIRLNRAEMFLLFDRLTDHLDSLVNDCNLVLLFQSYLNINSHFLQNVISSEFYQKMMELLTSKVYISECDLFKLIITFHKHVLFDQKLFNHVVQRMKSGFTVFDQDQIGNLARWLVRCLGYDLNDDYLAKNGVFWDKSHVNTIKDDELSGRVSDNCRIRLLKVLKHKALGMKPVKYIDKGIHSNHVINKGRLKDFNLENSGLIAIFSENLPYFLHEYRYYNLVDIAEMYYMFDIKDKDMIKRFGLEIWKHVPKMKYGYQIKALVIFALLDTCDNTSFKWMMRNIPQTLTFNWEPEMICDCIIALEKISIRKMALFDRLCIYLQKNLPNLKKSQLLVQTSRSLASVKSPQPSLLHQIARLADIEPKWMNLGQLISIASDCMALELKIAILFDNILNGGRLGELAQTEPKFLTLIPQIYLFHKCDSQNFIIGGDFKVFNNEMVKETLKKIVNDSKILFKVHFTDVLKFLQSLTNLSITLPELQQAVMGNLLQSNQKALESRHLPAVLSIVANSNNMEHNKLIMGILENIIVENCNKLTLDESVACLWYSHCIGFSADSQVISQLCQNIITFDNSSVKNDYFKHLIKVIACCIRCEAIDNNVSSLSQSVLRFLKRSDDLPDLSYLFDSNILKKIENTSQILGSEYKILVREPPFTIHIGKVDGVVPYQGIFVESDIYFQKLVVCNNIVNFEMSHLKPYYRTRAWYLGKKNWNIVYFNTVE